MKVQPLKPKVEELTTFDKCRIRFHQFLEISFMLILFVTSLHILVFYIKTLLWELPETTAVRYAVYIAIGCFFALFVHKKEIQDRFGARKVEPIDCNTRGTK